MTDKELAAWKSHQEANKERRERYTRTTDLREAMWLWREMLQLHTIDDCVERLAQEASLYLVVRETFDEDDGA